MDMLVHLTDLPPLEGALETLKTDGINIRRVMAYETSLLRDFILANFHRGWADETLIAFSRQPVTCYIATHNRRIIGFAAYECTARGFFGPTGVSEEFRGKGVGKALLIACLRSMREMGYGYGIIGGVGPAEFYTKCCGATIIPDSTPGIYIDPLED